MSGAEERARPGARRAGERPRRAAVARENPPVFHVFAEMYARAMRDRPAPLRPQLGPDAA